MSFCYVPFRVSCFLETQGWQTLTDFLVFQILLFEWESHTCREEVYWTLSVELVIFFLDWYSLANFCNNSLNIFDIVNNVDPLIHMISRHFRKDQLWNPWTHSFFRGVIIRIWFPAVHACWSKELAEFIHWQLNFLLQIESVCWTKETTRKIGDDQERERERRRRKTSKSHEHEALEEKRKEIWFPAPFHFLFSRWLHSLDKKYVARSSVPENNLLERLVILPLFALFILTLVSWGQETLYMIKGLGRRRRRRRRNMYLHRIWFDHLTKSLPWFQDTPNGMPIGIKVR